MKLSTNVGRNQKMKSVLPTPSGVELKSTVINIETKITNLNFEVSRMRSYQKMNVLKIEEIENDKHQESK